MNASGAVGMRYVDRGDVENPDWLLAALTFDAAWHDLDLSAIMGLGVKKVELLFGFMDTNTSNEFKVRQKGRTYEGNCDQRFIPTDGDIISGTLTCLTDEDGFIQYYGSSQVTVAYFGMAVRGWWDNIN